VAALPLVPSCVAPLPQRFLLAKQLVSKLA
jgi:hypothetical protein